MIGPVHRLILGICKYVKGQHFSVQRDKICSMRAMRITECTCVCYRCLRLGGYGLTVDGPIGHMWYKLLDKFVYPNDPQCMPAVLLKTAADQLLWAPVMTCVYFAFLRTAEGHPELIMSTIQVCCYAPFSGQLWAWLDCCVGHDIRCVWLTRDGLPCRRSWCRLWSPIMSCGRQPTSSTSNLFPHRFGY